jgi:hypothetical protein
MIDGKGYEWTNVKSNLLSMPNPEGGVYSDGVGNSGDGRAKITFLG